MARIIDRRNMTFAVDWNVKHLVSVFPWCCNVSLLGTSNGHFDNNLLILRDIYFRKQR